MRSRLREPFGKAGLIVAIVALVASLAGGAYAASSDSSGDATASKNKRNHKKGKRKQAGLNGKQKKQVRLISAALIKRSGTAGPAGPQGPAGPAGPKGDSGANGQDGQNGSNGSNGTNGESVTLAAATGCGVPGGTKLSVGASSKEVCNGEPGDEGSPWTAGGTLPEGATQTGSWYGVVDSPVFTRVAIDFSIPLGANLDGAGCASEEPATCDVYEVSLEEQKNEEVPAACTVEGTEGSAAQPLAAQGKLCVYTAGNEDATETFEPGEAEVITILRASVAETAQGASTAGALLGLGGIEGDKAWGTYAVTG